MKRLPTIIILTAMLITTLTACVGAKENGNRPTSTPSSGLADDVGNASVQEVENPPLVIYHISDDEIELRFTSGKLASIERLAFLAPTGDGNGSYNTSVNIDFERDSDRICPFLMVFNESMEIAYNVDVYSGEMEASVEGDTLICRIRHENIIAPFAKSALWHIDAEQPQPFEGVITDDVSSIIEPVVIGTLPDEFMHSEYDNEYFMPESDDFIVVTYEIPIRLPLPEWYQNATGEWHYGLYRSDKESNVKITYLISYVDGKYTSTRLRLEFASIDDAMISSLVFDYDIVPTALGLSNEPDDSLVTAEYFEDCDQRRYGSLSDSDHDVSYLGHFDQFRYFEYKVRDTLPELRTLMSVPITEHSDMLAFIAMSSLSYSAGETQTCELLEYSGNVTATTYSSKRTHEAGSDDTVLDTVLKLPGDVENFTPTTDDYAYVIEEDIRGEEASQNYGYDGVYEQFANLYSFDESGKIVQWIYRMYHIDHLNDDFEGYEYPESFKSWVFDKESGAYYIDYLAEYEGEDLFSSEDSTAKEYLLFDLTKYGQHEGFYFSKP